MLTSTAFGVYVVSLATTGDVFKGADIIASSSAIAAMWGVGGLIGPPLAGAAIDVFGMDAMLYTLAIIYVALLLGLFANGGKLVKSV